MDDELPSDDESRAPFRSWEMVAAEWNKRSGESLNAHNTRAIFHIALKKIRRQLRAGLHSELLQEGMEIE